MKGVRVLWDKGYTDVESTKELGLGLVAFIYIYIYIWTWSWWEEGRE